MYVLLLKSCLSLSCYSANLHRDQKFQIAIKFVIFSVVIDSVYFNDQMDENLLISIMPKINHEFSVVDLVLNYFGHSVCYF